MGAPELVQEVYATQEVATPMLQVVTPDFVPRAIRSEPEPENAPLAETAVKNERYAQSLRTIRKVGEVALQDDLPKEEADLSAEAMLRADFYTAVGEMLKTDKELRKVLDINPRAVYEVRNNEIILANGKRVVRMVEDGHEASLEAAKTRPLMFGQAERDSEDVRNAYRAEALPVGRMLIVPSADPLMGYKRDGQEFWDSLGYREGMVFFQWYYRKDDNTLISGSCSVEGNDRATLRQLLAGYDVFVPEDIPDAQWLRYGIEMDTTADADEAEELVKSVRQEFYRLNGTSDERFSVTDYIAANKQLMDEIFYQVYIPMAEASYTGRKNETIHEFMHSLLENSHDLRPEIRSEVMRIYNTESFDDEATRTTEFLIRYGTVERLRAMLPHVRRSQAGTETTPTQSFHTPPPLGEVHYAPQEAEPVTSLLAGNVAKGARAGRNYGGCAAGKEMGIDSNESGDSPQDSFGGKGEKKSESSSSEICIIETKNCYCCGLNLDGTPRKTRLTVKAYFDSNKTLHCMRGGCDAWLAEGGKNKNIGRIAKRAERLKAEQEKQAAVTPPVDQEDATKIVQLPVRPSAAEAADHQEDAVVLPFPKR